MYGNMKSLLVQGTNLVCPLLCADYHVAITTATACGVNEFLGFFVLDSCHCFGFFVEQKGQLSDRFIMFTSEYLQTLCKWLDRCKLSADAMGPSPFISKVHLLA